MLRRPASCLKNHFYKQQQSPAKRKNEAAVDSMVKFGPGSGSATSKRPQNGLGNPAIFFAFLSTTRKVLDTLSLKPLPCFKRMCVLSTSRNRKIVVIGMLFRVSNIQQMATPRIFGDFWTKTTDEAEGVLLFRSCPLWLNSRRGNLSSWPSKQRWIVGFPRRVLDSKRVDSRHKKKVQPKQIRTKRYQGRNVDGRNLKSGWPVKVVRFLTIYIYLLFTGFLGACQMVQDCADQEYPNSTSKLEWHHLSSIWCSLLICFPHFCLWHLSLNIGRNVHWFLPAIRSIVGHLQQTWDGARHEQGQDEKCTASSYDRHNNSNDSL